MKRSSDKKFRLTYLAGAAALIALFFIFMPKSSEQLLGGSLLPWMQASRGEVSEKLLPESVCTQLDDELYSRCAYFCSVDTHSVIAEKNSEQRVAPASLTKIMTAIVVLEHADDLGDRVTIPHDVYESLYAEGASMAGFSAGETVTLEDLLYGIMLPSGAEAAAAAARYVAGSDEAFIRLMNDKAAEMGLANTHFENIYGFDDEGHYSNASELASILMYALENEDFLRIASTESYTVAPTNKHPTGFTMKSTVFKKLGDESPATAVILGGKTGFTYDAGLCLAVFGENDGRMYVSVVLGAPGDHSTEQNQVHDTIYLFDSFT